MIFSNLDKEMIWHPFTQERTAKNIICAKKALGAYIYDQNDKAYLDLISSWWVNIHGHANAEIANSIYKQAKTLEHVIFAGFTHETAINLCKSLRTILPLKLAKFFFSDNGSTSVEVAIKMAYQYWRNLGYRDKSIFLSFEGGYHGDTFGAMSVGKKSGFHDQFKDLFFKVLAIPYADTWDDDREIEAKETQAIKVLQKYLKQYKGKIAAIVLEPLIQGAGGMRVCRVEFLQNIIKLVRENEILIIFDEVMTGFGRTGTHFAFEKLSDITPDFLCLSKGITGGFLPLALTITGDNIYEAFLGDDFSTAFAHGHSYTANPLACSAAIASFNLLMKAECKAAIQNINDTHHAGIKFLKKQCALIEKPRIIGTISAFDVKVPKDLVPTISAKLLSEGLLLRPLSNTIYLLPPYCISKKELENAYDKIGEVLNSFR
ncbi:Adenosylmethionine-8-amino-7-oxononanoate aminotransferase [Candidatus Fokinia solitaria]|uniref:Adenosylmethionine-8-amino-7-oxononanoate aminotransferase n=1 Tax=Candidatus Fokinia solitaria TaxID=1802984 RepID=A0A2U8BRZ6_9RICK|nr:adenosylmethionine--8-amino-7-oxononanoate transaminase [Candidatus Fokinia solitaria]AWD33112.1 Adenosylmethionine-8-amino-7-oxononanoate aminotransferase [Candidatus Fokinia solitaria]